MRASQGAATKHPSASLRLARYGVFVSVLVATVDAQPRLPPSPPPLSPSCACGTVSVVLNSSARFGIHSGRAGEYTKIDNVVQDGRAVYQHQQGDSGAYLYYWAAATGWLVGPDYTSGAAYLSSVSNPGSLCPEDAGSWKYKRGGSAWESEGVFVACPSPPLPPWPPGLAPQPPPPLPPWECDFFWETFFWTDIGRVLTGVLALVTQRAYVNGARPQLLFALALLQVILVAASIAQMLYRGLEWIECGDYWESPFWSFFTFLFAAISCYYRPKQIELYRTKLESIEGDLPTRLEDGSLRLLRVEWLRAQPSDWILERRQDLPDAAFCPPADALRLLKAGKVAALSYRWLGCTQNDPARFTLNAVLEYFGEGDRAKQHTAIMIDFASLPQVEPSTVTDSNPWGTRTEGDDEAIFKQGLAVMPNMYASPRVLVLQQTRMPADLEEELASFGGVPPDNHPRDLRPYAGEHCRSGWCTSEAGCVLLLTEGGGHAYELGVGVGPNRTGGRKVPVRRGVLPSEDQMRKLFRHESTRFGNPKDRDVVVEMYLGLRAKVEALENEISSCPVMVRKADALLTNEDEGGARKLHFSRILMLLTTLGLVGLVLFGVGLNTDEYSLLGFLLESLGFVSSTLAVYIASTRFLPSRILRAHLAAVLCCRPRDCLRHTFHWSLRKPPFRPRPHPASGLVWQDVHEQPESGVELTSTELAAALATKTEFTPEEWAAFGIGNLQLDHFIKAGDTYYQPFEIPDGFRPSVRSQTGARVLARQSSKVGPL